MGSSSMCVPWGDADAFLPFLAFSWLFSAFHWSCASFFFSFFLALLSSHVFALIPFFLAVSFLLSSSLVFLWFHWRLHLASVSFAALPTTWPALAFVCCVSLLCLHSFVSSDPVLLRGGVILSAPPLSRFPGSFLLGPALPWLIPICIPRIRAFPSPGSGISFSICSSS